MCLCEKYETSCYHVQMMSSDGFVSLQDRVFLESAELKPMAMSSVSGTSSEPKVPPDSPGSSVSSRLQVLMFSINFVNIPVNLLS